jgi:hypothetical protein
VVGTNQEKEMANKIRWTGILKRHQEPIRVDVGIASELT